MEGSNQQSKKTLVANILKWLISNWWYVLLTMISSIYMFVYRFKVYELTQINALALIGIVWVILLLLPLFSEFEFLGVKLKKELVKANVELKESIADIKMQIVDFKNVNYASMSVNVISSPLASKEQLEHLEFLIRELKASSQPTIITMQFENEEVPILLFKTRFEIESKLSNICLKLNYDGDRTISRMLQYLVRLNAIDARYYEIITQVNKIATRGVHGEIVSDNYIKLVKSAYPSIMDYLSTLEKNLVEYHCYKCGYSGFSTNPELCPNCNNKFHN